MVKNNYFASGQIMLLLQNPSQDSSRVPPQDIVHARVFQDNHLTMITAYSELRTQKMIYLTQILHFISP